jgi:stage III sporulation protein AA
MLKELLPSRLYMQISQQFCWGNIEEVRLRANCPVVVSQNGKNFALRDNISSCVVATDYDINFCIARATQNSVYAVSDQIRQMYIAYKGGVRIGLTGTVVAGADGISTIKHVNSLNIRIPHQIKNFASVALKFIETGGAILSTLVVSPPGVGKTTLLRDIARGLGTSNKIYNILLVDERCELAATVNGRPSLDVGLFTDVISGGTKQYAFTQGIRALKPDVIITDELVGDQDYEACKNAVKSGISVIASVHAQNQLDMCRNQKIKELLEDGIFKRIVVLSQDSQSRYAGIYDGNLKCLYMLI